MPRIKLAHWHGDHQPGEEIDVSDEDFAALSRDGRIAETVETPVAEAPSPQQEGEAQPEPEPQAEAEAPARKRR